MSDSLFTVKQLTSWTQGDVHGNSEVEVTSVAVDSRECLAGSLFFCLVGERVDGHDYIKNALENGSVGIVVAYDWFINNKDEVEENQKNDKLFFLVVDLPLKALQDAAFGYINTVKKTVRIGVTGSTGKTTTKELIASVLSQKFNVVKTEGNLNSEIGLPLSVFNIKNEHQYAIIEMGINRIGEMDILTNILRPDIVVITNIGTAHIGIFKDVETIAYEKRRATALFDQSSTLFLNENESFKDFLSEDLKGKVLFYGEKSLKNIFENLSFTNLGLSGWVFKTEEKQVVMPLIGKHNLCNALCAVALGFDQGLSIEEILSGLADVEKLFGRNQIIQEDITILNDCYNANIDSMVKALDFVCKLEWPYRKVVVVGDMKELGEQTAPQHERLIDFLVERQFGIVFLFGEFCKDAYQAIKLIDKKKSNSFETFHFIEDYSKLESSILKELKKGDLVLLKASRSMKLERLIEPMQSKFRRAVC